MVTLSYEHVINVVSSEFVILRREKPSLFSYNVEQGSEAVYKLCYHSSLRNFVFICLKIRETRIVV